MGLRQTTAVLGAILFASLVMPLTQAAAQPAQATPSGAEDHPTLTLSTEAPVTEDHPTLTIPAGTIPAGTIPAAPPPAGPVKAAGTSQDQVTAGVSMLNHPADVPGTAPTPQTADPMPVLGGTMAPEQSAAAPGETPGGAPAGAPMDPGQSDPSKTADAPPPEPIILEHPAVADTSQLATEARTVALSGVIGLKGQYAEALHGAIVSDGDKVVCQIQGDTNYMCLLPDGTDVAALAIRNGAAQTSPSSPASYHDLEGLARDERRGVWASLPPPPERVEHPKVPNTATLTGSGKTYMLDGLLGLGDQYARDLQSYIVANGDAVMCNPQGDAGHFVCLMADGTDLAKVALVNGAARVAADAPDSYRVEQGDALANKRGYWKNPPEDVLVASRGGSAPTAYRIVAGDDGSDGVTYVGGAPAAVIEGETVFLGYGGDDLGWGYYDHGHHWHGAPGRMGEHMNRFHPGGAGLRGYAGRPAEFHGAPGHNMMAGGPMPGHMGGGFVRPAPSPMGGFHPSPAGFHPAPAMHAAPAPARGHR